jgi:hypothetical protein
VNWQLVPQHAGVLHSQPPVLGAALLQSDQPLAQPPYVQPEAAQPPSKLCDVSHARPQPVQSVSVVIAVSQPSVFGTLAGLQSA